jgi:phenylalanyl-tRNA synthetase beta chain
VRPYVVGAILRNIKFDIQSYNSFIDLQDKLHNNICRKRTLASMGTHDYDKIQGPITYEALPPKDIIFKALKQTEAMSAD